MITERTSAMVVRVKELHAWATPKSEIPLDEFIDKMKAIGNEVLEVDRAGRRVKLAHVVNPDIKPIEKPGIDVYVCEKCGACGLNLEIVAAHELACIGV